MISAWCDLVVMETRELGDRTESVFAWEEAEEGAPLACPQTDTGAWHPVCVGADRLEMDLWVVSPCHVTRSIAVPRVHPPAALGWNGACKHSVFNSRVLQVSFLHLD